LSFVPEKVGVDHEPGLLGDQLGLAGGAQRVARRRGAAVLPDDRVRDRRARRAIPDDGGLALVGDANAGHVARRHAGLRERFVHDARLRCPDLVASCSTQPGCGKIWRNSCCAAPRIVPA
jgi:hypothetical protein